MPKAYITRSIGTDIIERTLFGVLSISPVPQGTDIIEKSVFEKTLFSWSEWRDLNSRPLDPQSSALPTALHPEIKFLCQPMFP